MGRIHKKLRDTIARNIREWRDKKFPGRGGGKKCAEAFSVHCGSNVSPQQWSPWERGMRTPDETRLEQLAKFFEVTVEYLRADHRKPPGAPPEPPKAREAAGGAASNFSPYAPAPPGSPASFFWLAQHFLYTVMNDGIRIRLDRKSVELLLSVLGKEIPR